MSDVETQAKVDSSLPAASGPCWLCKALAPTAEPYARVDGKRIDQIPSVWACDPHIPAKDGVIGWRRAS